MYYQRVVLLLGLAGLLVAAVVVEGCQELRVACLTDSDCVQGGNCTLCDPLNLTCTD